MKKVTIEKRMIQFMLTILIICALTTFMYLARGRYVYEGDRALYMDDLGAWGTFDPNNDISAWDKLTSTGAQKVRYVNNLCLIIVWKFIGVNYERIDLVMMINNIMLVSVFLFVIMKIIRETLKKSSFEYSDTSNLSSLLAAGGALVFSSSRFAYYSYEEMFGIMEALGSIFTFIVILLLFIDSFKLGKHYWVSYIFWILAVYSHERYMSLAGTLVCYLLLAFIYNGEKRNKLSKYFLRLLATIGLFALFVIHRLILFGDRSFDGTGGTSMKDTLSLASFIEMFTKHLLYLIGINPEGEVYLNGITTSAVNKWIYLLTLIVYFIVLAVFISYFSSIKKNKKELCRLFLFLITIACLTVSSSGTIRVEMRWLYTSFGLEIMALMYMISTIMANASVDRENKLLAIINENKSSIVGMTVASLVLLIVIIESFYACHWDDIYNWSKRVEACNLSDCLDGYTDINALYVINGDSSEIGAEDMKELGRAENHAISEIVFADSFEDIEDVDVSGDAVFILDHYRYTDITEMFNAFEYEEGRYEDGWCENYVRIICTATVPSSLGLSFYVPDYEFLTEGSTIEVFINSESKGRITVSPDFSGELVVDGISAGINTIELVSDYWVIDDSGRSENDKLAYLLTGIKLVNN